VVVNTHLYGMHLAMHGTLLPEHDLVVIDEAHQLEEVVSATAGIALAPGRFRFLARALRSVIVDPELVASLDDMADRWAEAIRPIWVNACLHPCPRISPARCACPQPSERASQRR
jgi:ATP-dependent DNA helicase DinG